MMAWVIYVCLDCKREYDREWSDSWKRDMKSHGLCGKCADKRGLR